MEHIDKSKTQKKNEDKALEGIARQLLDLSADKLEKLNLTETLYAAITEAKNTQKHGAKRRQIKYIRTILRETDIKPIGDMLQHQQFDNLESALVFQTIEKWRDALKDGNERIIEEIVEACPNTDRKQLLKLAGNARKEFEASSGKKSSSKASRMLFRYLREMIASKH